MDRRAFISGITLGLFAAPLAVRAQQAPKVHGIGIVWGTFPDASKVLFEPLREALRELGYVQGRNILFHQRWAEGRPDRFPELMDGLIQLNVEVIVVPVNPIIAAARHATKTIPIVMLFAVDPVGAEFVTSLARPGGNVTGLSIGQEPETLAKNLELLKEASPRLSTVVLLSNPASSGFDRYLRAIEDAARPRGIAIQRRSLRTIGEIETVLASIRNDNRSALLLLPDASTFAGREQIAQWALKNRLPTSATFKEFAESGGLMAYSADTRDLMRRAAAYIDKLLRGAKPADLPVEQPTKFELVINLKTAKALGLTIPPSLLQRADQVIE